MASVPFSHQTLKLDLTQRLFVWPSATRSMANIQREQGVTVDGLGSAGRSGVSVKVGAGEDARGSTTQHRRRAYE